MNDLRARLTGWRTQGHITIDQEEAIAGAAGAPDITATDHRLLEALTYLGATLFLIGALIIAFDVGVPDDFLAEDNRWGTFLLSLATSAALGIAAYLISQRTSHPATERGIGLTALAAWVAFFVAEVVLVATIIDLGEASTIVIGLGILATGFPLYRWRPGAPTHLALAIASVVTIAGFLVLVFDSEDLAGSVLFGFDPSTTVLLVAGLLFTGFGLGWMHLADRLYLRPRNLGYVLGAIVALVGAQLFTTIADGWVVIIVGLGLFIGLSGVWRSRSLLMAIGTFYFVVGFVNLLALIFDDSALSAGVVMLIGGAAALAAVIKRADSVGGGGPALPTPPPPSPGEAAPQ